MFGRFRKPEDDWQDRVKNHKQKLRDTSEEERIAAEEAARPRERRAVPRSGFGRRST